MYESIQHPVFPTGSRITRVTGRVVRRRRHRRTVILTIVWRHRWFWKKEERLELPLREAEVIGRREACKKNCISFSITEVE